MSLRVVINTSKMMCRTCRQASVGVFAPLARHRPVGHRGYVDKPPSTTQKFDIPDEYTEEVFRSLASNPPVMQAMHDVIESLERRGIKLDKEPSISEMWKIMKDKEIMTALSNLSKASSSAGIKLDHILKNIQWSEENTKWAQSQSSDPAYSSDAINARIKKIREILKRPEPGSGGTKSTSNERKTIPEHVLEDDMTQQLLSDKDLESQAEIQADLRAWWTPAEEAAFYERLSKFKTQRAGSVIDRDIYDLWIEEWARKVKGLS